MHFYSSLQLSQLQIDIENLKYSNILQILILNTPLIIV